MKNIYYIFLPIILLVSGCAEHSAIPGPDFEIQDGSYIFFDAEVIRTKGTLISGTLPSEVENSRFGVFGTRPDGSHIFDMYAAAPNDRQISSAFNNVAVMYRQEAGGVFHYDALALWMAGEHDFYAYYPYDYPKGMVGVTDVSTDYNDPYIIYTQPTALDQMIDVMTAKKTADSADGEVQFKFEHRLFAFDVIIQNQQFSTGRDVEITGATIKFEDVNSVGLLYYNGTHTTDVPITFDHDYFPEGTPSAILKTPEYDPEVGIMQPTEYNLNIKRDVEGNPMTDPNGEFIADSFFFLPCASLQVEFVLKFINAWNEECEFKTSSVIAPEGGLKAGHKYVFAINKKDNGEDIGFILDVLEWETFERPIDYEFN